MKEYLFKLILTVISVYMFSSQDKAGKRAVILAVIGSAIAFSGEYLMTMRTGNAFFVALFSAGATCVYSEIMARAVKIPSTIILLPALIPLVPGSLLYFAMRGLILGPYSEYAENITEALLSAAGIAVAAVVSGASAGLYKLFVRRIDKSLSGVYNRHRRSSGRSTDQDK